MWSEDEEREPVPVARDAERPVPTARWKVAGCSQITRTRSSTAAIQPRRLPPGVKLRRCCGPREFLSSAADAGTHLRVVDGCRATSPPTGLAHALAGADPPQPAPPPRPVDRYGRWLFSKRRSPVLPQLPTYCCVAVSEVMGQSTKSLRDRALHARLPLQAW